MDSTLAPCSTATLTYSSGLLSTIDHSTSNSFSSVLPVSSTSTSSSSNTTTVNSNQPSNLPIEDMIANLTINNEIPTAVLRCNSMPFETRVLNLNSSIMVGRAVARFKPSNRNAIFDCKVLSRNHALLWYENGKFYLQDTKSSNGTFVNQQRLSYANTESEPKEVFSGDVIQFGVDVVDNTRKVSHGCVIATLELYLPGGEEGPKRLPNCNVDGVNHTTIDTTDVQSYSSSSKPGVNSLPSFISCHPSSHSIRSITIPIHRLLEIETSLKEALNRESALEYKLCTLFDVLNNVTEASDKSWKSMVQEDRLLSRIELLESKLKTIYTCNNIKCADDKVKFLQDEIEKLLNERELYESTAKESLLTSSSKLIELNEKFVQVESDLNLTKEENNRLTDVNSNLERQFELFNDSHEKLVKEYDKLTSKHKSCEETINKLMLQSVFTVTSSYQLRIQELENELSKMDKYIENFSTSYENLASKFSSFIISNYDSIDKFKLLIESTVNDNTNIHTSKLTDEIAKVEKSIKLTQNERKNIDEIIKDEMAKLTFMKDEMKLITKKLNFTQDNLVSNIETNLKDKMNESNLTDALNDEDMLCHLISSNINGNIESSTYDSIISTTVTNSISNDEQNDSHHIIIKDEVTSKDDSTSKSILSTTTVTTTEAEVKANELAVATMDTTMTASTATTTTTSTTMNSKVDGNNLTRVEELEEQINKLQIEVKESSVKVQNLSQEVVNKNNQYIELTTIHNSSLIKQQQLNQQLEDIENRHSKYESELKTQITNLQLQLSQQQQQYDNLQSQLKSSQSLTLSTLSSTSSSSPSSSLSSSTTSSTLTSSQLTTSTLSNVSTKFEDVNNLDDLQFAQVNNEHLTTKPTKTIQERQNEALASVSTFNPLESPDGIFIIYDVILAIFFIVLLYVGSPSLYSSST